MLNKQTVVRIIRFCLLSLSRAGVIEIIQLSEKGRLTQFVERIEPFIRRKIIRLKWFPPILLAVNPTESPNIAVEEHFARQVLFVTSSSSGLLAGEMRANTQEVAGAKIGPIKCLKRPGSPWEMAPSVRRRDDWTYETNRLLERMHLAAGTPVVLLAVRDAVYYRALREKIGDSAGPETESDTYIRNPDLLTYSFAVEQLRARGYSVVYFGFPTQPLPPSLIGKVVDYSGQFRSPRGDLLLGRYCTMLISGCSGTWALASLFNKPVAYSNSYVPFVGGYSRRDRAIFQLIQDTKNGRTMTFREMARTQGAYSYQSNCDRDDMKLIKNSAEEIGELALETLDRRHRQFVSCAGDDDLLRRFAKIQAELPPRQGEASLPAVTFLRRHAHLLD